MSESVDPDVVYVLVMEWNNTQTYSEGDEITVHRTRADAVKEILTTVHSLGLGEGLAGDPEGNDPELNDTGTYWVDFEGHLTFRIERSELPPLSPYDADNLCRVCRAHFAEPHAPNCPHFD